MLQGRRDPREVVAEEPPLGPALGRPAEGIERRAPQVPGRTKDVEGRAGTADELDLALQAEAGQERRLEQVDRPRAREGLPEGLLFLVEQVQAGHLVLVLDGRQGIEAAGERLGDSARQRSPWPVVLAPPPGAPARGSARPPASLWKSMSSATRRPDDLREAVGPARVGLEVRRQRRAGPTGRGRTAAGAPVPACPREGGGHDLGRCHGGASPGDGGQAGRDVDPVEADRLGQLLGAERQEPGLEGGADEDEVGGQVVARQVLGDGLGIDAHHVVGPGGPGDPRPQSRRQRIGRALVAEHGGGRHLGHVEHGDRALGGGDRQRIVAGRPEEVETEEDVGAARAGMDVAFDRGRTRSARRR